MGSIRRFFGGLTHVPQGMTFVVAAFLPTFAIIAMFPIVASIINHFHDDPQAALKVPQMVTAPGYAIALLAPFAGLFVDRFGRRPILLVCTGLYGLVGLAPLFLENLDSIIVSRILLGVCEAGILTTVNTLLADYWEDRERRNWLLLQGLFGPAFQPLVFVAVAAIAAVRWNGGFLVYAIAFPVFAAMYVYLYEPKRPAVADRAVSTDAPAAAFPYARAAMVAGVTLFASIIYFTFIVNGSITWKEIGVTDPMKVSTATMIPSLFILAGAILFRLVSRYSNAVQIATFLGFLGVGLAAIGVARTLPQMQLGLIVQQTGAGMAIPALIAWAQLQFGFAYRGRGMGLWASAFFLGQAISPIIIGTLAGMAGTMQGAFVAIGTVALAGAVLALMVGAFGARRPVAVEA